MLAEKRRGLILEILDKKGSVSVAELHRRLKVSGETIRRDITRLAAGNKLRKTHGGALSVTLEEAAFADRMSVNIEGKRAIGKVAASLVPDGASLVIDSGTTTLALAQSLAPRSRLTVYTNDVHVAGLLAGRHDNRVFLLGGEMQGSEGAIMGRDATAMLAHYFADFTFVGASALTAAPRLLDFSREAAELRGQMLAQARTAVLLVDHTKFKRLASFGVANLDRVTHLITDRKPTGAMARGLGKLSADVLVAGKK